MAVKNRTRNCLIKTQSDQRLDIKPSSTADIQRTGKHQNAIDRKVNCFEITSNNIVEIMIFC